MAGETKKPPSIAAGRQPTFRGYDGSSHTTIARKADMPEKFDWNDLQAVRDAMLAFEARCEQIMAILADKKHLAPFERDEVQALYRQLKDDLKAAAKSGSIYGARSRDQLTRAEFAFYDPAVRRAAIDLRPATNSNPITSRWFSAVHEAQMEFSYYRHGLDKLIQGE